MIAIKKVIDKKIELELTEIILRYSKEYKLTATNIEEAVEKALFYMYDNAVLESEKSAGEV